MTSITSQKLMQSIIVHANMSNTQQTTMSSSSATNHATTTTTMVPIPKISSSDTEGSCGGTAAINGREARNLAEKNRRDKLNASIGELAKMVPHVADSPRRLDKTAVLRFATHGLRLQYVFGKSAARRRTSPKWDTQTMTNTLLQLLDSFFITLTCHGQIVLISSSIEHLLGHCQSDLYGQNILQITHPGDQDMLRQQLVPKDMESLFADLQSSKPATSLPTHYPQKQQRSYTTPTQQNQHDQNDEDHNYHYHHVENNENYLPKIDEKLRLDKRCFTVRLARASTRSEAKKIYEIVKIDGCFRRSDFSAASTGTGSYPIVSQLIRRSRNNTASTMQGGGSGCDGLSSGSSVFIPHLLQHDAIAQAALHGISGNDIVLVAMARIIRPPKIINYSLEANRLEYKTRHLIDGRIIDCDHRIGLVAGYLKEEVRNLSPFSFMHQDDVRWVIVALRQMYDCNSDYGESCYRLLSRNGDFIYLSTKGFLDIDKGTNKVHSFVCVNTLLDEEEGKRKVQEMKNKFSIIINAKVPTNTMQDAPASQNPQQLERIVLYLIENLQKRQTTSSGCVLDDIHSDDESKHHTYTHPLALVPPETSSVKNSISKSVSVVISTAAKNLALQKNYKNNSDNEELFMNNKEKIQNTSNMLPRASVLQMRSKSLQDKIASSPGSTNPSSPENSQSAQHISVLKRLRVDTLTTATAATTITETSLLSPISQQEDENLHTPQPAKRSSTNSTYSSPNNNTSTTNSFCLSPSPPSPTKRINDDVDNDKSDIHNFISSSLRHVGDSLHCIDAHTSTLRQQCSSSGRLPTCLDNKLDAINIERQKQNELFVNIKNEYEVYKEQLPPKSPKHTTQHTRQQQQQHQQQHQPSSSHDML